MLGMRAYFCFYLTNLVLAQISLAGPPPARLCRWRAPRQSRRPCCRCSRARGAPRSRRRWSGARPRRAPGGRVARPPAPRPAAWSGSTAAGPARPSAPAAAPSAAVSHHIFSCPCQPLRLSLSGEMCLRLASRVCAEYTASEKERGGRTSASASPGAMAESLAASSA